ncbi:hypothetical protein ACFU7Y_05205 [Kitasatospora sp. NPDC057542]|uniref:hypothetical protein n=1 Tax=Kitasatospora sp. NPDC057542 TaxID=3346162 RepID=UPI0036A222E1
MDSMNPDMIPPTMISLTRAAGTLRSLVKQLAREQSPAIVIEEEGAPQAVLISFGSFQRLLETAGEADAAMIASRLTSAPAAGEGLSNLALEKLVTDAQGSASGVDSARGDAAE